MKTIRQPSVFIAKGISMRRSQSFGALVDFTKGTSCALGALSEGYLGRKFEDEDDAADGYESVLQAIPWMDRKVTSCPACDEGEYDDVIVDIVAHLNDKHIWNRARIGRWLDAVAPKARRPKKTIAAKRSAGVGQSTIKGKRIAQGAQSPKRSPKPSETEERNQGQTTDVQTSDMIQREEEDELVCV